MEELLKKIDLALVNKRGVDNDVFVSILSDYLFLTKKTNKQLADEMRLSVTCFDRWIAGRNLPILAMRVPMLRWIKKDIENGYKS